MEPRPVGEAIAWLEKANADLDPELLTMDAAREVLAEYARAERLVAFGKAALTRRLDDAGVIARMTGTSIGKAKETVETAKRLRDSDEVSGALRSGEISFDQASEIAKTEESRPGSARELIDVAKDEAFHVLRDKSRRLRLEAEQRRDLASRQHEARSARSFTDELGMIDIHLRLEPHIGVPIVNRAEAEASRLHRKARRDGRQESYERHLADAFGKMLTGSSVKGRAHRPELVVLVSHEVATRGWKDVREGEICKIPGIGPVSPRVAKDIAQDAFLSGVLYDGVDLRNLRRWTRTIPVEVRVALELGKAPEFEGVKCVDCGNRFRNENDHVEPYASGNPSSLDNFEHRCWPCHEKKTERDRKAGKLGKKKRGPPVP
jgi:5-methylcytosine-specific restriction endonuclease McrA